MHKVIAVYGYKRSGKDTIADFMVKKYNYEKICIAEPLKEVCKILFDLSDDMLNGSSKEEPLQKWHGKTPRQLLQFMGTEVMQYKMREFMPECNRNFWIDKICHKIKSNPNQKFIIPDLRFMHEFDALEKQIGKENIMFINVIKPDLDENDTHESEFDWKKINTPHKIYNSNTIDHLYTELDALIKRNCHLAFKNIDIV